MGQIRQALDELGESLLLIRYPGQARLVDASPDGAAVATPGHGGHLPSSACWPADGGATTHGSSAGSSQRSAALG